MEEQNTPVSENLPSSTSHIFKKFQKLYAKQLKEVDETPGSDGLKLKVKILENWVEDLTEQNMMLVKTVDELESEALKRLSVLEANLNQGQETTLAEGTFGRHSNLSKGLNSQIETLCRELELVKSQLSDKEKLISTYQTRIEELGSTIEEGKADNSERVFAQSYSKPESVYDQDRNVQPSVYRELENTRLQLTQVEKEVIQLKKKLKEAESNIKRLRSDLVSSEKNAKEMRAALTAEVADKHDQILALRREVNQLEEQLRQADMQTHFKDDIIKELRKEVKVARSKLEFLGLYPSINTSSTPEKIRPIKAPTSPTFVPVPEKLDKSKNINSIVKARATEEVDHVKTCKVNTKAASVQYVNKATSTSPVREYKSEHSPKSPQCRNKRKELPHRHYVGKVVELDKETNPELVYERTEVCPVHGDISVWTTVCAHSKDFIYK